MVNCPLCDAAIDVEEDELDEGDALTCEECGANLTVDGVDPLELSAEDDDDDEEDEEFDEFDEEDEEDEDGDDMDDSDDEDNDGWR
jgi:alpha-aminoadipate carrier protein LysW